MEEGSGRRKALPKVMKDYVHAVNFYLLDGLPESSGEVSYGLLFLFYYCLQRTNIPLMSHWAKVLRDEHGLELVE